MSHPMFFIKVMQLKKQVGARKTNTCKMPGFFQFVKMYENPLVSMLVRNGDHFGNLDYVILIFEVSQVWACQFDPSV